MLGQEINLMANYPRSNRDVNDRGEGKTASDRAVACGFGKEYFDGSRVQGYGGFQYIPKFWEKVIPDFQAHWNLKSGNTVLDVGCAKGFMLHDMVRLISGLHVKGLDVSEYAIANAIEDMRDHCQVGNAMSLPFDDNSFDFVLSISAVHNLELRECGIALQEIERVSKLGSYVTVCAYRDEEEKRRQQAWNLTVKTLMHVDEWKAFFKEVGYTGDFYWFIP